MDGHFIIKARTSYVKPSFTSALQRISFSLQTVSHSFSSTKARINDHIEQSRNLKYVEQKEETGYMCRSDANKIRNSVYANLKLINSSRRRVHQAQAEVGLRRT